MMTLLVMYVYDASVPSELSSYFAENTYTEAHSKNLVNTILVDFRALDTLGEITVLAVAGIGVFGLLKLWKKEKKAKK